MPDTRAEQRHNLTHAIGECILAWAKIEQSITVTYATAMGSEPLRTAFIFDAVINIDARMAMVHKAIQWSTSEASVDTKKTLATEWKVLSGKIKAKYKMRHEVAHVDVVDLHPNDKRGRVAVLPFPTLHDSIMVAIPDNPIKVLSLSDLNLRRDSFDSLYELMREFFLKLKSHLWPQATFPL